MRLALHQCVELLNVGVVSRNVPFERIFDISGVGSKKGGKKADEEKAEKDRGKRRGCVPPPVFVQERLLSLPGFPAHHFSSFRTYSSVSIIIRQFAVFVNISSLFRRLVV
jgi:hypothetical protein